MMNDATGVVFTIVRSGDDILLTNGTVLHMTAINVPAITARIYPSAIRTSDDAAVSQKSGRSGKRYDPFDHIVRRHHEYLTQRSTETTCHMASQNAATASTFKYFLMRILLCNIVEAFIGKCSAHRFWVCLKEYIQILFSPRSSYLLP